MHDGVKDRPFVRRSGREVLLERHGGRTLMRLAGAAKLSPALRTGPRGHGPMLPQPSVGTGVAGPPVLPITAHRGVTARQASLIKQVAPNPLHGGRFARGPDPRPRWDAGGPDLGNEGVTRRIPGRQRHPPDCDPWTGGQVDLG